MEGLRLKGQIEGSCLGGCSRFYNDLICLFVMTELVNMDKVYREILALREEVHFIKKHIFDAEIMANEEEIFLENALVEHKAGKTKKIDDLRKELGD